LRIKGGSASPLVQSQNGFKLVVNDTSGVPVGANTDMPALTGANLAINSCRMYTFFADVSYTTGAVTLSVLAGNDFSKSRPMHPSIDINYGDGQSAIVGYVYIKNESAGAFVPGTTNLDVAGLTVSFNDAFGYHQQIPTPALV
jgi:hypothetical protein